MRKYETSTQFEKDLKKAIKQTSPKRNLEELKEVMRTLAEDKTLPPNKRDHNLKGSYIGYRECHVQPDFLLIYKKYKKENFLVIRFERLGTHSELFS
jgi:mRNA interferase YafQ